MLPQPQLSARHADVAGSRTGKLEQAFQAHRLLLRPELGTLDLFYFLGVLLAARMGGDSFALEWVPVVLGWLSLLCARASLHALEDGCESKSEATHHVRHFHPVATGAVSARAAMIWWLLLSCGAIVLAMESNPHFAAIALLAWFIGSAHAAAPFRADDFPVMRVFGPAVRFPVHLALGWFSLGATERPPGLLIGATWMTGAFLVGTALIATSRRGPERVGRQPIDRAQLIGTLLCFLIAVACVACLALQIRVELLLALPFGVAWGAYYLSLGYRRYLPHPNTARLCREPIFLALATTFAFAVVNAATATLPDLHQWLKV